MIFSNRSRKILLFGGDIALLYLSLFITLVLRYGSLPSQKLWNVHKMPFLFVYLLWALIFYIAGLYEIEKFLSPAGLRNRIFKTMMTCGWLTIFLFYLIPFFRIAPKTNLVINILIATVFIWFWRKLIFDRAVKSSKTRVFFFGKEKKEIADFAEYLSERPQLGFETANHAGGADIIIVPEELKRDSEIVHSLYETALLGKTIIGFDKFYESITERVPVSLISEEWFFENLMELNKQGFEKFKRVADFIFSLILFIPFIIILPLAAIAIKLNSKGPVFYKQKRVGKRGKIFEIIKFRSMVAGAEKNGAQWAKEKDKRITFIGNILRRTRLDELPQIWNVLGGNLSFVGPRPERPEFVKELEKIIPHYQMRHLIKPGLTGWAQINFPYGASVEDATEKLQYDLYYIKNRSILLELVILLKTTMVVLSRKGR